MQLIVSDVRSILDQCFPTFPPHGRNTKIVFHIPKNPTYEHAQRQEQVESTEHF